ncbi:hypothetical protein ACFL0Y_03230 [Patescibacteria group bacterium]
MTPAEIKVLGQEEGSFVNNGETFYGLRGGEQVEIIGKPYGFEVKPSIRPEDTVSSKFSYDDGRSAVQLDGGLVVVARL